jgi:hypothetical protein
MNLMNISVADDQAKQWLSLNENRCDLGGEALEKRFVNRPGSVHGERDTPCSSRRCGALERRTDAPVP